MFAGVGSVGRDNGGNGKRPGGARPRGLLGKGFPPAHGLAPKWEISNDYATM